MALLDLDDNDLRTLNDALVQMPYHRVAPLIDKINRQLTPPDDAPPGRHRADPAPLTPATDYTG